MSRDSRRHGHQAFMAWSQSSLFIKMATVSDSSWEDFFSGLVNLLDMCKNYSFNVNLDFPSAAILFNQLDITVSVLRIVSDGVANLSFNIILTRKYFDSTRFAYMRFSLSSSHALLEMKCDIQIYYEMVSNAHVHQLTVSL